MTNTVLEIRNYLLQPHMREHFIDYFEANFITTQAAVNMFVLGQFRLLGEPDHFVWIRGYENMDTRLHGLQSFYDGPIWKQHRNRTNGMLIDSDNVHLLCPLAGNPDLTAGQTAPSMSAAIADASISPDTGLIVVDFYETLPDQREALVEAFQTEVMPLYQKADIQWRGCFVAEMSQNTFPRHPAIQNKHELVVITAYESEVTYQKQHKKLSSAIETAVDKYLSQPPSNLLLNPTLRSPIRYVPK